MKIEKESLGKKVCFAFKNNDNLQLEGAKQLTHEKTGKQSDRQPNR